MHIPKETEDDMKVVRANAVEPMFLPTGKTIPAKLEILAYDIDLDAPGQVIQPEDGEGWLIAYYGPLCLFFPADGEGHEEVDESEPIFEGVFNSAGVAAESVVPVYVRTKAHPEYRLLFAPVSMARDILAEFVNTEEDGRWVFRANDRNAVKGLVTFDLIHERH